MTAKDPLKIIEVVIDDMRRFAIVPPQGTMKGVAQSILILQNIKSRNVLTKEEMKAIQQLIDIFGTVPIWEDKDD